MKNALTYYQTIKETELNSRYISYDHIVPLMRKIGLKFSIDAIGKSVKGLPIQSIVLGEGSIKILLWSQMHGNESTTTKSVFDLLNAFLDDNTPDYIRQILKDCTLTIIPMLNPDGANAYTRHNSNDIDLNRDAQALSQPESVALRAVYDSFKPDYCFNLHGQRTIYGFEDSGKPSVLSFLSPSANKERDITLSRKRAMSVISYVNRSLQPLLPGQIGRYDDGFNLNCVGDTFQQLETPTVLFEAGHYRGDYDRDVTRKYVFLALVNALQACSFKKIIAPNEYFEIPEHQKCYCDVIITNAIIEGRKDAMSIKIQFDEFLMEGKVAFLPKIQEIGKLDVCNAHRVIDANFQVVKALDGSNLMVDDDVLQILIGERITTTL